MPVLSPSDGLVPDDDGGGGGGDISSTQRIDVKNLADLASFLSGGIYTISDNLTVNLLENIDLAGDRMVLGAGCSLNGVSDLSTTLSGPTLVDVPLIANAGNLEIVRLTVTQTSVGEGILMDVAGAVVEIIDVNLNGRLIARQGQLLQMTLGNHTSTLSSVLQIDGQVDFIIADGAQLFWPQIPGAICVDYTLNAINQRTTFDGATPLLRDLTAGFDDVPDSIGFRVDAMAQVTILTQMNAGFRPLSTNSRHLVVVDPASVDFGFFEGNTFDNGGTNGTLYGCEPVPSDSENFPADPGLGTQGLSYDGTDILAIVNLDTPTDLTEIKQGTGLDILSPRSQIDVAGNIAIFDIASYGTFWLVVQGDTLFETNKTRSALTGAGTKSWLLANLLDIDSNPLLAIKGIASDGSNVFIAGVKSTDVYHIFVFSSDLPSSADLSNNTAIAEFSIGSLVDIGNAYLDYDGVNIVMSSQFLDFAFSNDPQVPGNWTPAAELDTPVTVGVDEVRFQNQNAPVVNDLNYAELTFSAVSGDSYQIFATHESTSTNIVLEVFDGAASLGSATSINFTDTTTVSFVATNTTLTLRLKIDSNTANFFSDLQVTVLATNNPVATVFKGIEGVVQYQAPLANPAGAAGIVKGITTLTQSPDLVTDPVSAGFCQFSNTTGNADTLHIYNTDLTMDQSSDTWLVRSNVGDSVIGSHAKGGSSFIDKSSAGGTGAIITGLVANTFVNIANFDQTPDDEIFYVPFTNREKVALFNHNTGSVIFTGMREEAKSITATLTVEPSVSNTVGKLIVAINGVRQDDSVVSVAFGSPSSDQTLSTTLNSRNLRNGDIIEALVSWDTATSLEVHSVHLSIS